MKRLKIGAISALLVLGLLVGSAGAAGSGVLHEASLQLSGDLTLTGAYLDQGDGAKEQVLTYTPGGDVTPLVVYGDTLYGRSTMDYIQSYLSKKGYTAVGAINASFFDMSTGIPYGMLVTDGVLRTSGNVTTVGILEDGSVTIGVPELTMKLTYAGGTTDLNYNKALSKSNGFCLYSQDYDYVTKNGLKGYYLVLEAAETELTTSSTVEAKVVDVVENETLADIPEDGFLLGIAMDTDYKTALQNAKSMKVGDTVTITTTVSSGWEDVVYAVGGGELLVENGRALSGFTLDTAKKQVARTALGLLKNGDVICYTVDKGHGSNGMTLEELAERLAELGCVTAINLDGGGSTCIGVTQPGDTTFTTVNHPSDGKQRECANYLFFVRPTTTAGVAAQLYLYPYDAAVLPGGQVEMTVKAVDRNYMAATVPSSVSLTATGGALEGSTFTAGSAGTATVRASAGGLQTSVSVLVVESPSSITLSRQDDGKALEKLVVENGTSVDLTAQATYLGTDISAQDTSFTWSLTPAVGTVDENGVLIAGEDNATGELTVTCGKTSVTIPVEVKGNPFVDTKEHWAKDYITELYLEGVLQGSKNEDGEMVYRPDDSMTRQEFVASLIRWLGVDSAQYADVELPFADTDKISAWALQDVKAAYTLGYFTGSGSGENRRANPTATITREEAMTILARTAQLESDSDALSRFSDADSVSSWAKPAITAMVELGVIDGSGGKLQPQGNVTRAQVAKMLCTMPE